MVKWRDLSKQLKASDDDLLELNVAPTSRESVEVDTVGDGFDSDDPDSDYDDDDEPVHTNHPTTANFSVEEQMPGLDLASPALYDLLDDTPPKSGQSKVQGKEKDAGRKAVDAWKDAAAFDWNDEGL